MDSAGINKLSGRFKSARVSSLRGGAGATPPNGPAAPESADWVLLGAVLVLLGFGLTMLLSASGVAAQRLYDDQYYFFKKQIAFAALGLLGLWAAYAAPRALIERLQYLFLFGCIGLLLLCLTPAGVSVNGARRWLNLGFIRVQPMEFCKIALVLYLAYFMSGKQEIIKTFSRGILPPFLITGLLCLLLLAQPDFGGALVLAMLLFFMCLIGGTRLLYLFASGALALGAAALLVIMEPYRFKRLTSSLDPFADPLGSGYQLVQSLYAIGSGGVGGVGLGAGRQKLFYLPEAHTDFILSVLAEELGLIGITLVFVLLAVLFWRGLKIALAQPDLRGRLTAFGLTLVLTIPMLLNLAVISGSVPTKGVPMPFFSYGGTSLLASLICVGLLLNYAKDGAKNGAKGGAPGRAGGGRNVA